MLTFTTISISLMRKMKHKEVRCQQSYTRKSQGLPCKSVRSSFTIALNYCLILHLKKYNSYLTRGMWEIPQMFTKCDCRTSTWLSFSNHEIILHEGFPGQFRKTSIECKKNFQVDQRVQFGLLTGRVATAVHTPKTTSPVTKQNPKVSEAVQMYN